MAKCCDTCIHGLGGGYDNCRINLEAECADGDYEAWEPRLITCARCAHCFELADTDPMTPWNGGAEGFYCEAWDMDLYAPHYDARTFFCGDAKPREG